MKYILLPIFLVFLTGFVIETPESIAENQRRAKEWRESVLSKYDLESLLGFLKSKIGEYHTVDGVDLSESKLETQWTVNDWVLRTGDWAFENHTLPPNEFNLSWVYETNFGTDGAGPFKEIVFHCRRIERDKFEVLSASAREYEIILLSP